ncbi:MAG: nucleotide exchange factor GrpE [Magnetococcales bacterium]|nr:nucleotide exchange factor GrpE [Magnetococcales bacterium]
MLSPGQEALLAQFRDYLEQTGEEPVADEPQVDLYTLFGELAALKNEIRIESRQVKSALEQFRALVDPLRAGHAAMEEKIQRMHEEPRLAGQEALRPVLLELLELRDRLIASLEMSPARQEDNRFFKRLFRKRQERIEAWHAGQEMLLWRLDQLLTAQEIQPLELLDRPFDPRLARAVRVACHNGVADGVVRTEMRKGFLWHGELLRLAEVVVNKIEEQ